MNTFKKISYYDLREEAASGTFTPIVGRTQEIERLYRITERRINNNILIVGPGGLGKTTLVYGWMRDMARSKSHEHLSMVQLDIEHLYAFDDNAPEGEYSEALAQLPSGVVFIDNFGREVHKNFALMSRVFRLYRELLGRRDTHVVLTMQPHEYTWLVQEYPSLVNSFETLQLKNQSIDEQARILGKTLPRLNAQHHVIVPDAVLKEIVQYAERFPTLGQMPRASIMLLDEVVSFAAGKKEKMVRSETIATVVETKTGVPKAQLSKDAINHIKYLERDLNARIVDQQTAIKKIATTLQRAKLGLRNPDRPLGSFLLLGPSGVGKTETAKAVAELMFGRSESFIRFDMSEFQQDHTVQRLIGAPSGYIGFEEGGALTNALKKEPYSLILLDEIEKAHPKVFDLFLQVLDDGRLTSGQNETVDARNAIVMATSNTAVTEILEVSSHGMQADEAFVKETIMPILAKTFRLEFINRFDSILIFQPLGTESLVRIAQLEIKKIERRLEKHRVQFDLEPSVIEREIRTLADPRFGARPVKRFVEETCETLLMESLLSSR
ncbi:ATP-dependent Clp protease ATP-binding subunit [Candidatus Parcubacteria bacterium]|nr:MAG: ATP-dependent Clp protease ATP-binding subunit [Candidatus Parcubacteria bacterium]